MTAFLNSAPKVGEVDFENEPVEDILDPSEGTKGFYDRHWKWALSQATEMMRPIAERFGQNNVVFTPENDELIVLPQKEVDENCHGLLGTLAPRKFFGCTEQDDWSGLLDGAYTRPPSRTYLAEEWAASYISNAAHHELSHQAIISVRQILQKDHKDRRNRGFRSLSDAAYDSIMKRFSKMDRELDFMDIASVDKKTGKL